MLPYFKKSEGLAPSDDIPIDAAAHSSAGPLGVSVRSPVLPGAREFVDAAEAAGIPRGDYNGRDRGGRPASSRCCRPSTRAGKRSSTYRAFLEGDAGAPAESHDHHRGAGDARDSGRLARQRSAATGVEYRTADGETGVALATQRSHAERRRGRVAALAAALRHRAAARARGGRRPLSVDSPHVGKHLKDHLQVALFFPAPGVGVSMGEVGISFGPTRFAHPPALCPRIPRRRAMPAELQALKQEAERRITEWATTGRGLVSSSLYDACAWFSTGLGDHHTPRRADRLLRAAATTTTSGTLPERRHRPVFRRRRRSVWRPTPRACSCWRIRCSRTAKARSCSKAPTLRPPGHPHELLRRPARHEGHGRGACAARWRSWRTGRRTGQIGPLLVPPFLASKHGYVEGAMPSDALLEDLALHFSLTVYHLTTHLPDRQRRRSAAARDGRRESCASRTRASCQTSSAATPTRRRS